MSGYYWYQDNPNCGRCGHLNSRGFCNMTACLYPVLPQTALTKQKPQTNADRIRSMTDEELADFMIGAAQRGGKPTYSGLVRWLDWLKQEVTE